MKKVLSLVLVIAMVLSSMSFAFAGTFEDVTDATQAKAVDALSSLGVVKGNPDGTYKPESSITRAEMAAMLVRALGHSDLAAGSSSSFKDAKDQWYDGEVAVAQSLGLTDGYPDGTFKGDNKVSYTESITMIMRALGYNNRAVNSNRTEAYNATAYKTTAARLGVLNHITLTTGDANRGDVAVMLYNALEVQVVVPDENGNPVLQWITAPNVAQGVTGQARTMLDDVAIRSEVVIGTGDLFGAHLTDVSEYLGEKVVAYTNKDGEILFVKSSVDASVNRIVTKGTIDAVSTAANTFTVLRADNTAKDFGVTSAASIDLIVNNVKQTAVSNKDAVAQIASSYNRVHSIKVVGTNEKMTIVIEDVTHTLQASAEYVAGKTKFQGIALPTKDGKVNTDKIVFSGAAASLEDIEVGDVVQACVASNNIKFYVTRDTIQGKVEEEVNAGSKYVISGETYWLNGTGSAVTSLDLGSEGTFCLDKDGNIAFASAESTAVSNYGIITAMAAGTSGKVFTNDNVSIKTAPKVRMVTTDGKEKVYDLVVKLDATGNATQAANGFTVDTTVAGTVNIGLKSDIIADSKIMQSSTSTNEYLVKYTLNDDGKITKIEKVSLGGYETAKKTSPKFLAGSNTVVLGRDTAGEYSVINLDNLTDNTVGYQVVTNASNFGWDIVVITTGIDASSTIKTLAVVKGISNVINGAGSTVQKLTAWVDGVEVTYLTDAAGAFASADKNTVVSLKFNTAGLVTGVDNLATANPAIQIGGVVTAAAINSNGTVIKVDGANVDEYYTLSANVVVYKTNSNGTVSVGDLSDIRITNGTAQVSLFDKDGDKVIDAILMK